MVGAGRAMELAFRGAKEVEAYTLLGVRRPGYSRV